MEIEPWLIVGGLGLLYWWYRRVRRSRQPEDDWITQGESRTATGDGDMRTPDRGETVQDGGTQFEMQDPTDTPFFLQQQGWEKVSESPEQYVGRYRGNGVLMGGGLERTPAGRRKFYVHQPTREFTKRAHRGFCLRSRDDLAKNSYEVHFATEPDSFGDGIEMIENAVTK